MKELLRSCLNWKVALSLAAIAVGVWAIAPDLFRPILPLLAFAVCPISMLLMMRGMQGAVRSERSPADPMGDSSQSLDELKAERSALSKTIDRIEAEMSAGRSDDGPRPSGEPDHAA